jgi:Family of unknown function (DUF6011)
MTDLTTTDWERRIMALDWHDVAKGFYALHVHETDEPYEFLGYKLFERRTPRTYKNGRTVGADGWRRSYALAPGVAPSREALNKLLENALDGTELCRQMDLDEILYDPQRAQAEFGKLTGRCGCCGKTLTDPNSKMRGIGPECLKGRR